MAESKACPFVLADDVVPQHYALELEPNLEACTFAGKMSIQCEVRVATERIQLNIKGLMLDISSVEFTAEGATPKSFVLLTACEKPQDSIIEFTFAEVLPVGKGNLAMAWRGDIRRELAGFYRSNYMNVAGESKVLASTMFCAVDARRCFPCWDEPAVKASFQLSLVLPPGLTAVANMPEQKVEALTCGKRRMQFMPTPKMSSYLLAFAVGEFEFVQDWSMEANCMVRILCCPGKASRCTLALRTAKSALEYFNGFFGCHYPLPKMDMIGIPDFELGAMENWGLVTYRETRILCDESNVAISQKRQIVDTIAHETSHQWFGNLVTPKWWNDIWLSEGFASWMATKCAADLHPEWKLWESFVSGTQLAALELDGLRGSHALNVEINRAEEALEIFDAISYNKGACMVHMVFNVLGEDVFKEGLRIYFARHGHGNTKTQDLWRAWGEASEKSGKKSLESMMRTWTEQMGYPVLEVLNDPFEDPAGKAAIEQRWFISDGSKMAGDGDKLWEIPVLAGGNGERRNDLQFMSSKRHDLYLSDMTKNASWLKLNFGQAVLCRIKYPASMLARVITHLADISVEDRVGLISDTFAFCKAGDLPLSQLLSLLAGFMKEENDKVWSTLSFVLRKLGHHIKFGFDGLPQKRYGEFVSKLLHDCLVLVGWDCAEQDDDNRKALREKIIDIAASFSVDDAGFRKIASEKFEAFCHDRSVARLSAEIRQAVFRVALKCDPDEGPSGTYERLVSMYRTEQDAEVQKDICLALGAAPSELMLQKTLVWILTEEVRLQDLPVLLQGVSSNSRAGARLACGWLKREYSSLHGRLGSGSIGTWARIVGCTSAGCVKHEEAAELQAFWESLPVYDQVRKKLKQVVENIRLSAAFIENIGQSGVTEHGFWDQITEKP
eukprot:TRINITY_DN20925_c0_g1_i1.p1 TRINITY_DN20925_c0_g1~~TRINITY_DN20925_c0_g1_i1.p1  ORF type:complete len:913 (-),score=101.78 TRINITY_DN20925_c0_g1_i1:177-2867(-)